MGQKAMRRGVESHFSGRRFELAYNITITIFLAGEDHIKMSDTFLWKRRVLGEGPWNYKFTYTYTQKLV